MINYFNNLHDPVVKGEIDIYDFLDRVKNPDVNIKNRIEQARSCHSFDKRKYTLIKEQLPCFTLNFSFRERKSNNNIKEPTGFIYIDVDGKIDIDLSNEYIFASWLSLSGTGRGILVKVDGLTKENIKYVFNELSLILKVPSDKRAVKATQFCVHSYDEDLYYNEDSKTFFVNEECYKNGNLKNTPTSNHKIKEKRVNTEMGEFQKLRFNNIDDYDFKGQEYIAFWGEKESIAEVYIQSLIPEGMRESCLSTTAHQIKALNQEITKEQLLHLVSYINHKCCVPPLPENEILKIVNNKDRLENAELIYNKERRVIFNPDKKLNKKQKSFITNGIVGEIRKEKSKQRIRDSLGNWDFDGLGKITQQKLVKVSGLCKNTIESYGKEFRERIQQMNEDFKNLT